MTESVHHPAPDHGGSVHLPKGSISPLVFGLGFALIAFGIIFNPSISDALGQFFPIPYPLAMLGLAVILAAVAVWLWGNIRERPAGTETPLVAAKFAMWAFLGTEVIIFGALLSRAVILNIQDPTVYDHLLGAEAAQGGFTLSLALVSINTFLLLVSSLMVVLGVDRIQHGSARGLAGFLFLTALLGATFVGIQAFEYSKLMAEGFEFPGGQFESAFYFLTGNHGLHVIIGVIWAVVVVLRALRGGFSADDHMGVEVFGLYWHFVDVVWILIFTLVYLI